MSKASSTRVAAGQGEDSRFSVVVGEIAGYLVVVREDTVVVRRGDELITRQTAVGLEKFVKRAKDLKLGWGRFEDDFEVIYLYDKGDDMFGYAVNLSDEWCSEWGYAPF